MRMFHLSHNRTAVRLAAIWACAVGFANPTFAQGDPLKELVQALEEGRVEPPERWVEVLQSQPRHTTSDLWKLLETGQSPKVLAAYGQTLQQVCALSAKSHAEEALAPNIWNSRVTLCTEIVELLGKKTQVDQLMTLLAVPNSEGQNAYRVRAHTRQIQEALLRGLERDEDVLETLRRHYSRTAPLADSMLLRAIGDCTHPDAADSLASLLGKRVELDPILLNQVSAVLRTPGTRLGENGLRRVRPLITDKNLYRCQSAIRTLGYADDVISIEPLIALLHDPRKVVQDETLQTLQRITAMTIEGHPDRWRNWFDEETRWWRLQAPQTLAQLDTARPTDIAATLRELAGKRLFRREITPRILPLLQDSRPEVVRLTMATIESLRPPIEVVESPLRRMLNHPHPVVRAEAERIIVFLGGQASPASATAMRPRPR